MAVKEYVVIDKVSNIVKQIAQCEETDTDELFPTMLVLPMPDDSRINLGMLYFNDRFWTPVVSRQALGTPLYSKLGFRNLFTADELHKLDSFEYDTEISNEDKMKLRSHNANLDCVSTFTLHEDYVVKLLEHLHTIGYLTTERLADIKERA